MSVPYSPMLPTWAEVTQRWDALTPVERQDLMRRYRDLPTIVTIRGHSTYSQDWDEGSDDDNGMDFWCAQSMQEIRQKFGAPNILLDIRRALA